MNNKKILAACKRVERELLLSEDSTPEINPFRDDVKLIVTILQTLLLKEKKHGTRS